MAKIRLTEAKRDMVFSYMASQYNAKHEKGEATRLFDKLLSKVNTMIRQKYPEEEMAVLRKYNGTRHDRCIRFSQGSTGRVFALELWQDPRQDEVADVPAGRGCHTNDIYPATDAFTKLFDDWKQAYNDEVKARDEATTQYRAFLTACRNVEEVEAVVALPVELREKLGATANSLVAVNDDTLARIKADFAEAA